MLGRGIAPLGISGDSFSSPLLRAASQSDDFRRSTSLLDTTLQGAHEADLASQALLQAPPSHGLLARAPSRKKSVVFADDADQGAVLAAGGHHEQNEDTAFGLHGTVPGRRLANLWQGAGGGAASSRSARRWNRRWRRVARYLQPRYWLHMANKHLPIVHPEDPRRRAWDLFVILLVVYCAVMIPYEVGFGMDRNQGFRDGDQVIDILFWMDLLSNFRTAFVDFQGNLVRDGGRCAHHYTTTWLAIDLCASIPFDQIVMACATNLSPGTLNALMMLRTPRLLRLGRLLRFFDRMKGANFIRFMRLLFFMTMVAHWVACMWFLLFRLLRTRLKFSFSLLGDASMTTFYLNAYLQTFLLMIGNDVSPIANVERLFCTAVLILGACFYAIVVGNMGLLINNLNPTAARHKFKKDTITNTIRYLGAPQDIKDRVDEYYDYLGTYSHPGPEGMALINGLPTSMSHDISLWMYKDLITAVPLFRSCEDPFLSQLVMRLKLSVFLPGEVIFHIGDVGHEMYFLAKGHVAVLNELGEMLTVLHQGGFFGELALLATARRTAQCVALSHCDLALLSGGDLMAAMRDFPASAQRVRTQAVQRFTDLQAAGTIGEASDAPTAPVHLAKLNPTAFAKANTAGGSPAAVKVLTPRKMTPAAGDDNQSGQRPDQGDPSWIASPRRRRDDGWDASALPDGAAATSASPRGSGGRPLLTLGAPLPAGGGITSVEDISLETLDLLDQAQAAVTRMSGKMGVLQGRMGDIQGRLVRVEAGRGAGMDGQGPDPNANSMFPFEQQY